MRFVQEDLDKLPKDAWDQHFRNRPSGNIPVNVCYLDDGPVVLGIVGDDD